MFNLLNIPEHTACRQCGSCCGYVPASTDEVAVIRRYLNIHPDIIPVSKSGINCPFLDCESKLCMIYPVRPVICRLKGVSEGLNCKNGNSAEINGYQFLLGYSLKDIQLLNSIKWT